MAAQFWWSSKVPREHRLRTCGRRFAFFCYRVVNPINKVLLLQAHSQPIDSIYQAKPIFHSLCLLCFVCVLVFFTSPACVLLHSYVHLTALHSHSPCQSTYLITSIAVNMRHLHLLLFPLVSFVGRLLGTLHYWSGQRPSHLPSEVFPF